MIYDDEFEMVSFIVKFIIISELKSISYKRRTEFKKPKCFSSRLAVVYAQSAETVC